MCGIGCEMESEEQVELSFTRTWNLSLEGKLAPLNIDKRFIGYPAAALGANFKLVQVNK